MTRSSGYAESSHTDFDTRRRGCERLEPRASLMPRMRSQTILPLLVSTPNAFPVEVRSTRSLWNPKVSRYKLTGAFGSEGDDTVSYFPVRNLVPKRIMYDGKFYSVIGADRISESKTCHIAIACGGYVPVIQLPDVAASGRTPLQHWSAGSSFPGDPRIRSL
jgi:hypothetical protein